MATPSQIKQVSVSLFLAVSIILVFLLYVTAIIKSIPCSNNVLSIFYSNFVHIDVVHLMGNLFALYSLSRVEKAIGTKKFISLIIFLLLFTTILEVSVHKIFPSVPCSIGFSGILFGITAWELVTNKGLDLWMLLSISILVILPSLKNPKLSLIGHGIGAISGIVGGFLWSITQNH